MPAPRASDEYYDRRGRRASYRVCHDTADVVYNFHNKTTGARAKVYQGGLARANDLDFLHASNIRLVINCTHNLWAPRWVNQPGAPVWHRFPIAGDIFDATPSAFHRPLLRLVCVCGCVCVCVRVWVPAAPAAF